MTANYEQTFELVELSIKKMTNINYATLASFNFRILSPPGVLRHYFNPMGERTVVPIIPLVALLYLWSWRLEWAQVR